MTILLLLFFSFTNQGQELRYFSPVPKLTINTILQTTGLTRSALANYSCSNSRRKSLFRDTGLQKTDSSGLRIADSRQREFVYLNKAIYDLRGMKVYTSNKFVNRAVDSLNKIAESKAGATLIDRLQSSAFITTVAEGGNRYSAARYKQRADWFKNNVSMISALSELRPLVAKIPFNKIGHHGVVFWSPSKTMKSIESDRVERITPSYIILAHELYHAYDGVRGLLDPRFVSDKEMEFLAVQEFRAVRFENTIRDEFGIKKRRFYSRPESLYSKQSLLNSDGNTYILSEPCVDWL